MNDDIGISYAVAGIQNGHDAPLIYGTSTELSR